MQKSNKLSDNFPQGNNKKDQDIIKLQNQQQILRQIKHIFKKQVFYVQLHYNGQVLQSEEYTKLIKMMGGQVLKRITNRTTIVITNWRKGTFFNRIQRLNIPMISINWIEQCVQQRKKVPYQDFLIEKQEKKHSQEKDMEKQRQQQEESQYLAAQMKINIMQINEDYQTFFKPKSYLKVIKQNSVVSKKENVIKIREIDLGPQPRKSDKSIKPKKPVRLTLNKQNKIKSQKQSNSEQTNECVKSERTQSAKESDTDERQNNKKNQVILAKPQTIDSILAKYIRSQSPQNKQQKKFKQQKPQLIPFMNYEGEQYNETNYETPFFEPTKIDKQGNKHQYQSLVKQQKQYDSQISLNRTKSMIKQKNNEFLPIYNQIRVLKVFSNDCLIRKLIQSFNQKAILKKQKIFLQLQPYEENQYIYIVSSSKIDHILASLSKCNKIVQSGFINKLSTINMKIHPIKDRQLNILISQFTLALPIRKQFVKDKKITVLDSINSSGLQYIVKTLGGHYISKQKYMITDCDIIISNKRDLHTNGSQQHKVITQLHFINEICKK